MRYILGLDAGGTKTDVCLYRDSQIIGQTTSVGMNLHNKDAYGVVLSDIEALLRTHGMMNSSVIIDFLVLGFAGLDDQSDYLRAQDIAHEIGDILPFGICLLLPDTLLALVAGVNQFPAICVVAGTGACTLGVRSDGTEVKSGNWGYLLGDQASGFYLGKSILENAIKELDYRTPQTELSKQVLTYFGQTSLESLVGYIYHQQDPIATIASVTQVLSEEPWKHNPVVVRSIRKAVDEIMLALIAVAYQFEVQESPLPVVLSGGLFKLDTQITQPVIQHIHEALPRLIPIIQKKKPVAGVIRLVEMSVSGIKLPDSVRYYSTSY